MSIFLIWFINIVKYIIRFANTETFLYFWYDSYLFKIYYCFLKWSIFPTINF